MDGIYQRLREDISESRRLPGDRFSEGGVAGRMAASRTPVRQALYRLEREGYLEVHFRSGWQVRPFDFERFEALYDEYRKAPDVTRKRMYFETMAALLPKVDRKLVIDESAKGVLPLLQLGDLAGKKPEVQP